MIRTLQASTTLLAAVLMTTACTVGPDYKPREVKAPAQFVQAATTSPASTITAWWTTFSDPTLNALIEEGLAGNLDLRLALQRVEESRQLLGIEKAGYAPTLDANGSYTRSQNSLTARNAPEPPVGTERQSNLYSAGFDASWEIDVFGRVKRSVQAARADLAALEDEQRDALVTYLAEVARNYIELRNAQQQIVLTTKNLGTQKETFSLTTKRLDAGIGTDLDVQRSRAQVATTAADLPDLERQARERIHRLSVLLGKEPGALIERLNAPGPIPQFPSEALAGVPSELLRRRPDLRAAERRVAAATERVGVAKADLYPRFSLTGDIGLSATDPSEFELGDSTFYSFGPRVSWPIFNAGSLRRQVKARNSRVDQAITQFEQTWLTALEDVENSLVAWARERERRQALAEAVQANARAVALSTELNKKGLEDFLSVLESERSLLSSERLLARSDADQALAVVSLYKALGGGWEKALPEAPTPAPAAAKPTQSAEAKKEVAPAAKPETATPPAPKP